MTQPSNQRRLLTFGDIHGCLAELNRLLEITDPNDRDQLVFLGDYIDRGPDSAGVIKRLLRIQDQHPHTVFLCGNHEQMLLDYLSGSNKSLFLANGGRETIISYESEFEWPPPASHQQFLNCLRDRYETAEFIFAHAGLRPGIALADQTRDDLLWIRTEFLESDYDWGKPVVFGHTPREEPLITSRRIGLDTGCVYGRKLTCCDLLSGRIWQEKRVH